MAHQLFDVSPTDPWTLVSVVAIVAAAGLPASYDFILSTLNVPFGIAAIVEAMPFSRIDEAIERVRRREVPMGLVLESRD
jgi:hypothetical protein